MCWIVVLIAVLFHGSSVGADVAEPINYSRHVQSIFAEHCLQCHGPDAENREADLRLDFEHSTKASAVVAGNPDASDLLHRIVSDDSDLRMPPDEAKSLSAEQVEIIRQWIASGAKYEQHWAYEPIRDERSRTNGQQTDIDSFVLDKLHSSGLSLSQPATKQQLIRRATFDLTGLPPTWTEVQDFQNDSSPRAFEQVVDRLLDSPAYGERWGRHWLDIARYADTHGGAAIGFKRFAFSYTYRDYVIGAFNKDLPYDQFVKEQIAADQLGLATNAKQLSALGFLTVGMQFRNPHDGVDDQIDVVTRGLMGLTVTCARCHDHKFDVISTKDYYSLYATLASSQKPTEMPVIGEPQPSDELQAYQADLASLKTSYSDMARDQNEVMRGRLRMQVGLYLREIAKLAPEPDLSTSDIFSYRTDDLRPHVLHRWQRYLKAMSEDDPVFGPWYKLAAINGTDDFAAECVELLGVLREENGEAEQGLHRLSADAPRWNPRVLHVLSERKSTSMLDVADAYGDLFGEVHGEWLRSLLAVSLEAIPGNKPVPDEDAKHLIVNSPVHRQLRRHLYGPGTPTNVEDSVASRILNRPINDNLNGRREAIHNLNLSSPGSPPRAMVLRERSGAEEFYVFNRGNPIDRGAPVKARFLTSLGGSDQHPYAAGKKRLELARSIVDPVNPLTRRVAVNWVWQHHFGKGIVRTPDDFGTRGEPPTHPELLDYLAAKLLEEGWSLKKLHRRIMLTKVYQQASIERADARNRDPDNRRLWRMPRRRLEFEAMRDAMLAVSGELKSSNGGRPFGLLSDPIVPKRSVYSFVNRDIVNPLTSIFDVANPNACTAKRSNTTVPQQTLFALNSNFIQDRAAALAKLVSERLLVSSGEPQTNREQPDIIKKNRVRELFRRVYSREPDQAEWKVAVDYVTAGNAEEDEMRRWQQLAHVLLASNEFVFVD
ncbi:PSD1 and planctomycete cytochrome C domain-containing protein [Planctomycetota bacterium]